MSEWLDIETAPKDGASVLVFCDHKTEAQASAYVVEVPMVRPLEVLK